MPGKKPRVFATVPQIMETYFPAYVTAQREREGEVDAGQLGAKLATRLAQEFRRNLRKAAASSRRRQKPRLAAP